MDKILTNDEINQFKNDGAIFLKDKFDIQWLEKLNKGIERDIKNPSPRFKSHTIRANVPAYLEDYWTWDLVPEFKDFVFNSPYAKIACELDTLGDFRLWGWCQKAGARGSPRGSQNEAGFVLYIIPG